MDQFSCRALSLSFLALAACSNSGPTSAPTIASFTETPASLPYGGGSVTLSWTQSNATTVTIDHGVGDVSSSSQKVVTVTAATTFTLTSSEAHFGLANNDGEGWTEVATATGVGSATAFHPELYLSQGSVQPFFGGCGDAKVSDEVAPPANTQQRKVSIEAFP